MFALHISVVQRVVKSFVALEARDFINTKSHKKMKKISLKTLITRTVLASPVCTMQTHVAHSEFKLSARATRRKLVTQVQLGSRCESMLSSRAPSIHPVTRRPEITHRPQKCANLPLTEQESCLKQESSFMEFSKCEPLVRYQVNEIYIRTRERVTLYVSKSRCLLNYLVEARET